MGGHRVRIHYRPTYLIGLLGFKFVGEGQQDEPVSLAVQSSSTQGSSEAASSGVTGAKGAKHCLSGGGELSHVD
jgi:hypothetical protein